jgi:peptide/nickel transport system permease protein
MTLPSLPVPPAAATPTARRYFGSFDPAHLSVYFSLAVLLFFLIAALWPSLLASGDPLAADRSRLLQPPSLENYFGTDQIGRDVYTRVVHGARSSLVLGIGAVMISVSVGAVLGLLAGLTRSIVPMLVRQATDIGAAFPELLLAIFIVALFGSGVVNATIAIGIAGIPYFTRIIRAETLRVRGAAYVEAAFGLGLSRTQVVLRHIVPNALRPVVVLATLGLGGATLAGAALSFLGLGTPPPYPEWGAMLTNARNFLTLGWWAAVFPGLALTLFVMSTTLIGRRLRSHLEGRR